MIRPFRITALALAISAALPAQGAEPGVFRLGEIMVSAAPLSDMPLTGSRVELDDLRRFDRETVGSALQTVPGAVMSRVGARNEQMAYVRGFDLRQVPLFIDGIPVYVPYDGYVDLGRFTTFDLSRIEIAKGFSSMLYGANTVGGAINLVSRRPTKPFEGEAGAGLTFTDHGESASYRAYTNLGVNRDTWYAQVGASYLEQNYYRLPGDFTPVKGEDGGRRDNSASRDAKVNFKLGLTPNATDEYTLNYINQQGEKGTPPYAGSVAGVTPRYWKWPYWNKESLYLLSHTAIGEHALKVRLYHDAFKNSLWSYDDATYTTQKKPSSFQSWYDDYTDGLSVEGDFSLSTANKLAAAYHWKEDVHRENNAGEPLRHFRDRTQSVGLEDTHQLSERLALVTGLGYDRRETLEAQDYNATTKVVSDFARDGNHAAKGQAGLFYTLDRDARVQATVARKSRFATIKDRYSYRMGTAIPNAALKTEKADHYELAYFDKVGGLAGEAHLFYADITDLIQSVAIAPSMCSAPPCTQMQNVGKASAGGLELAVRGQLAAAWKANANYTWLERKNRSDPNVRLTDTPRHKLFAALSWMPAPAWEVTASVDALSSRYSSTDGKQVAAGFSVADLKAGYTLSHGLKVEGGVRNLFDKLYAYSEGFPEPGRTFFVQLNASL